MFSLVSSRRVVSIASRVPRTLVPAVIVLSLITFAAPPSGAVGGKWVDTTTTDFNSGVRNGVNVASTGGGQLTVPSFADTDFNGSTVPAGWTNEQWFSDGTTQVSGGVIVSNGTKIGTDFTYTPGQRVDVRAKFTGEPSQFVGLSQAAAAEPSAGFDTVEGGVMYAYVDGATRQAIPGSWFGAFHDYRVIWNWNRVDYYIDNVYKTSISLPFGLMLRPVVTDGVTDSGSLTVDSFRISQVNDVATNYFNGSTVPSGWVSEPYEGGGNATVASGIMTVEGTRVGTDKGYHAGARADVLAKFSGAPSQFVGFGQAGISEDLPLFNTVEGGTLYAYVNGSIRQAIPGSWFNSYHTYRVDWSATKADFYIDGVYKATLPVPAGRVMRPLIGDGVVDGSTVAVSSYVLQTSPVSASADFNGSSVPTGWYSEQWQPSGVTSVASGNLVSDGTRIGTNSMYNAGMRADVRATFTQGASQFVGFAREAGAELAPGFDTVEGDGLYAYVDGATRQLVPGNWFGIPHDYRIDWKATEVDYYIDGNYVTSIAVPTGFAGRPVVSDGVFDSASLTVDSFTTSSLSGTGTFTSRVFDSGTSSEWSSASWTASVPSGARLSVAYRIGNSPSPDTTWTSFAPVGTSGVPLSGTARYAQYQLVFERSITNSGPTVNDVTLNYHGLYGDTSSTDFASGSFLDTEVQSSSGGEVVLISSSTTGVFTSRVFDGGAGATWTRVGWNASVQGDGSLIVRYRTGNTATPGGTWSSFSETLSGATINAPGRYLQYEAEFRASTDGTSPILNSVDLRA